MDLQFLVYTLLHVTLPVAPIEKNHAYDVLLLLLKVWFNILKQEHTDSEKELIMLPLAFPFSNLVLSNQVERAITI